MSKKWQSILLTLACTSSLFCNTTPTEAPQLPQQDEKTPSEEDQLCTFSKRPMRVTARHIEANGIGYGEGYTTLEGFFSPIHPWGEDEEWVPFADLRGHAFNDGRLAANAGLGIRYINNYVYGFNAYYDYRDTHRGHYNQFSAGLEALGQIWDFRINGYLPVGRKNSKYYRTRFDKFEDHYLYLSRKKEVSLKGANAEVGYHFDYFENMPFYFVAGTYYLHGTGKTAWGGQIRARIDYYDYFTVEGNLSYDHLFKWVGQGQVSFNMPFGARRQVKRSTDRSCKSSMALSSRALQRVDRFEIIPVDHKRVSKKAISPVTGDPYLFYFVDNTSHSLGTFESPFSMLMDAQLSSGPNDVIMVFVGDGTSNGMNSGITLQDGQRLWGSVVSHTLPTTVGKITVPSLQSGNGVVGTQGNATYAMLPIITNTTGNVVTIGNNNEISGIYINNSSGYGITNPAIKAVANLTVDRCTIQGSGDGINLTDLGGKLLALSNRFYRDAGTEPTGILLDNGFSSLSVVALDNTFLGQHDASYAYIWYVYGTAHGNLTLNGNEMNVGDLPVYLEADDTARITATINDNQINGGAYGVYLYANGSNMTVSLEDNTLTSGLFPAFYIEQLAGSVSVTAENNQITCALNDGIFASLDGTNANLSFIENNIVSGDSAIVITQTAGSLTSLIANNTLTALENSSSTFNEGIHLSFSGSDANFTIDGNAINGVNDAMAIIQSGGTWSGVINNNTFASTFENGMHVSMTGGTQNLTTTDNTVTQAAAGFFGMELSASGSSTAFWNLTGNAYETLSVPAVSLTSGGSSSVCVEFNDNVAYPIQIGGVGTYQFTNSGGTFIYNPLIGNTGQFSLTGLVEQGSCQ